VSELTTVQDAIAEEIAKVAAIVATPDEPHGYGSDVNCLAEIDPLWEIVDGEDPNAVVQAVARRYLSDRGSLPGDTEEDREYGHALIQYLNAPLTQRDLLGVQGRLRAEALKDDRVANAQVTVQTTGSAVTVSVRLELTNPYVAVPEFTLAVTSAGAVLEVLKS